MTPRPLQQFPTRRRKVSIEIYFVLYLSAIILLLGTTPSHHSTREDELEDVIRNLLVSDFRLKVDKEAMLMPFIPASASVDTSGTLLRRDSVNTITAFGTFSSVDFTIASIEDTVTHHGIAAERASLVRADKRSVFFQWRPTSTDEGGVFRVTVAGHATPLPPANLRPELRDKVMEILSRRGSVTDSVSFLVHLFAIRDSSGINRYVVMQVPSADSTHATSATAPTATTLVPGTLLGTAAFELTAPDVDVLTPTGMNWHTTINLTGSATMNDLDITVDPPSVTITKKTLTFFEVGGNPTGAASQKVIVHATRRSDGRTATATFNVKTVPLQQAPVPSVMMVGQEYPLNFTVNGIANQHIAVEVIENDRVVRIGRDQQRSAFNYSPSAETHSVKFVRYVDGRQVDAIIVDDIRPLPIPSAATPPTTPRNATEVSVTTVAYGVLYGKANECVLKIKSGNADDPQEVHRDFDERTRRLTQTWLVRRKDKAQEFRFKAYALDQRGSLYGKSQEISFVAAQ